MKKVVVVLGNCDDRQREDVYVYTFRTTNEQLMLSALVPFQSIRMTKSFIAHIAFIRFLVRVNALVPFQTTRLSKTAHIIISFV